MAKPRSRLRPPKKSPAPEQQQAVEGDGLPTEEGAMLEKLAAIADELLKTRKDAIEGRASSGIEKVWIEDEEHYEGIDDKNRNQLQSDWKSKPPGQATPRVNQNESIEFPNITRAYVDAAAARVGDIILPTDDRPWDLKPEPVPLLLDKALGKLPQDVQEGMQQAGVPQDKQQQVVDVEKQEAQKQLDQATKLAEEASDHIEGWLQESQWHSEMRKVIHECCRLGSGLLKGPMPRTKRVVAFKGGQAVVIEEVKPTSRKISLWNFYPDPACGDSIHNGAFTWEVDFITKRQLINLKDEVDEDGQPVYVHSQIDLCYDEGPKKAAGQRKTADGKDVKDGSLYEIWYFHGFATREDLVAAGVKIPETLKGSFAIPAMYTMVNDRVIRASLNPLDSGEFPYDVLPWKTRQNSPWGAGVSREIRTAQRIVTAATRVMLTNGGRAAGPIFARKRGAVTGADQTGDNITPWKMLDVDDAEEDVAKAFKMFEIPDRQQSLQNIINYGLKLAEDTTGLPMLLQGQMGSAPDTLGGQQLAERNANSVLRRIARNVDDYITEPHLRRYYTYFLMYGPDEKKGAFVLDARGSTDLVEREIYRQEVQALLSASLNPAFGLDPKRTMQEHLRTSKKNPTLFQYTPQELQKIEEAQQQRPADPSVQVAQIRAEVDKITTKMETDSRERVAKMTLEERVMEYAEKRGITLDQIKADLAALVMKLKTQEKLSAQDMAHDTKKHVDSIHAQVSRDRMKPALTPPTEPAGRARKGRSFVE